MVAQNEPLFTIGPHWKNAVLFFFTVNICVGTVINCLEKGWVSSFMNFSLILWDVVTLFLMLYNPGMAPIDPHVHRIEYLHSIQRSNCELKICKHCNIIMGENGHFKSKETTHCLECNVCYLG